MTLTAGYDVGGAHLKVAIIEDGRVVAVRQIACPLWLGLDQLGTALDEAKVNDGGRNASRHDDDRGTDRDFPEPASGRCLTCCISH